MENTKEEDQIKKNMIIEESAKIIERIERKMDDLEYEGAKLGKKMSFLITQNKMLINALFSIAHTSDVLKGNQPHIDMIINKTINDLEQLQIDFMQNYVKEDNKEEKGDNAVNFI